MASCLAASLSAISPARSGLPSSTMTISYWSVRLSATHSAFSATTSTVASSLNTGKKTLRLGGGTDGTRIVRDLIVDTAPRQVLLASVGTNLTCGPDGRSVRISMCSEKLPTFVLRLARRCSPIALSSRLPRDDQALPPHQTPDG